MTSLAETAPKAFLVGTAAGVLGSLAGMGGGFVMIPLMTSSLLKLSQHQAHGTSLFAVAATGLAGALGYSGQVDLEAAAAIAACGMITARLGATLTTALSERALKKALGIFMLAVAPLVPAKAYFVSKSNTLDHNNEQQQSKQQSKSQQSKSQQSKSQQSKSQQLNTEVPPLSSSLSSSSSSSWMTRFVTPAVIGCFSGFLAGLFGVGGGAIVVPALTVATDMTHYQALGTSLCAMTLPALSGTYTHFVKGNVALRVAPALAVGSFVGAYAGGKWIGLNVDENTLRWGFTGLMVMLGIRTIVAKA